MSKSKLISTYIVILVCWVSFSSSTGFHVYELQQQQQHPVTRGQAWLTLTTQKPLEVTWSRDVLNTKTGNVHSATCDEQKHGIEKLVSPLPSTTCSCASRDTLSFMNSSLMTFFSANFSYLVSPRKQVSQIGLMVVTQIILQDIHWTFLRLMLLLSIKLPIYCVSKRQRLQLQQGLVESTCHTPATATHIRCRETQDEKEKDHKLMLHLIFTELGQFLLGSYCLEW
jgi:hypothetical protein